MPKLVKKRVDRVGPYVSRSQQYKSKGLWAKIQRAKKNPTPKQAKKKTPAPSIPRQYSLRGGANKRNITISRTHLPKLRHSITPGTVLILLHGDHPGRRVVFLKQLEHTGQLLCTGPFQINGVPFVRIPQSFVIATSTKIDISNVKIPEAVNDEIFKKKYSMKKKKGAQLFFATKSKEKVNFPELMEEFKKLQKEVDDQVVPAVKKADPLMPKYLKSCFTLNKNSRPHLLKF
eukprot:gb/GECH01011140.1/.p1 GENE.gb/GECH01011140.1/~~gb/GECH01011140.1/.p1  ORF type:complete len:232 (+),score=47.00 gb/GECH01011140.1/:1-696(+)